MLSLAHSALRQKAAAYLQAAPLPQPLAPPPPPLLMMMDKVAPGQVAFIAANIRHLLVGEAAPAPRVQ